jgi:hypothetical protein
MTSQFVDDFEFEEDENVENVKQSLEQEGTNKEKGERALDTGDLNEVSPSSSPSSSSSPTPSPPPSSFSDRRSQCLLICMLDFALFHSLSDPVSALAKLFPANSMPQRLQTELLHLALENNLTTPEWIYSGNGAQFIDFLLSLQSYSLSSKQKRQLELLNGEMKRQIIIHSWQHLNKEYEQKKQDDNELININFQEILRLNLLELWNKISNENPLEPVKQIGNERNKGRNAGNSVEQMLKDEVESYLLDPLLWPSNSFPALFTRYSYEEFSFHLKEFLNELRSSWPTPRLEQWLKSMPSEKWRNTANSLIQEKTKAKVSQKLEGPTQANSMEIQKEKNEQKMDQNETSESANPSNEEKIKSNENTKPSIRQSSSPAPVASSSLLSPTSAHLKRPAPSDSSPSKRHASNLPQIDFQLVQSVRFEDLVFEFKEVDWNEIGNQTVPSIQKFLTGKKQQKTSKEQTNKKPATPASARYNK